MNLEVLREVDYQPLRMEVARLTDYEVSICPRANIQRKKDSCVYGLLASASHDELSRLYRHASDVLGAIYLPEAVLVETNEGNFRPALCYICPKMEPREPEDDYVDRIVGPAIKNQFPSWYVEQLNSFKKKTHQEAACSLPPQEFQQRRKTVVHELREAATKIRETDDGYEISFPADSDLLQKLFAFIDFERKCCSFLSFQLKVPQSSEPVTLMIGGSAEAKNFLREALETKS